MPWRDGLGTSRFHPHYRSRPDPTQSARRLSFRPQLYRQYFLVLSLAEAGVDTAEPVCLEPSTSIYHRLDGIVGISWLLRRGAGIEQRGLLLRYFRRGNPTNRHKD